MRLLKQRRSLIHRSPGPLRRTSPASDRIRPRRSIPRSPARADTSGSQHFIGDALGFWCRWHPGACGAFLRQPAAIRCSQRMTNRRPRQSHRAAGARRHRDRTDSQSLEASNNGGADLPRLTSGRDAPVPSFSCGHDHSAAGRQHGACRCYQPACAGRLPTACSLVLGSTRSPVLSGLA